MKSSCTRLPQRIIRRSYGTCQNAATAVRISSTCAAAISGCGGISKARNSTKPSRPEELSGENILSTQNSVRWVLPVMSTRMLRNSRSVTQGAMISGASLAGLELGEGDFQLAHGVLPRLVDARDAGSSGR